MQRAEASTAAKGGADAKVPLRRLSNRGRGESESRCDYKYSETVIVMSKAEANRKG
jgi:hypothetical protein